MMHRASRRWWLLEWWRKRYGDRLLAEAIGDQLDLNEAVGLQSRPRTLPLGHPWRHVPCLVCHVWPIDVPCRVVTLVDPRLERPARWQLGAVTVLVCAAHDKVTYDDLLDMACEAAAPAVPRHPLHPYTEVPAPAGAGVPAVTP